MKDNLEEFIKANRGEFDDLSPSLDLWGKIDDQLIRPEQEHSTSIKMVWKISIAASIVLAFCIGLLVRPSLDTTQVAAVEEEISPTQELYEVESYYAQVIDEKKSNIRLILNENKMVDQEMLDDLDDLDIMYFELKAQLEQSQNNERVINAMIQNLQLRVEILNKQLKVLEQLGKKDKNEEIVAI